MFVHDFVEYHSVVNIFVALGQLAWNELSF